MRSPHFFFYSVIPGSSMTSILKMELTINEKRNTEVLEAVLKVNFVLIGKVVGSNDEVSVP